MRSRKLTSRVLHVRRWNRVGCTKENDGGHSVNAQNPTGPLFSRAPIFRGQGFHGETSGHEGLLRFDQCHYFFMVRTQVPVTNFTGHEKSFANLPFARALASASGALRKSADHRQERATTRMTPSRRRHRTETMVVTGCQSLFPCLS